MLVENIDTTKTTGTVNRQPLTETEAAARLGLKVATLRAWRNQGRGPAYVRLGRAIRYLEIDIDEFLDSNRHRPRLEHKSSPQAKSVAGRSSASRPAERQTATSERSPHLSDKGR
jgi:predicted DNA-binding transcriptional regulator AlpA